MMAHLQPRRTNPTDVGLPYRNKKSVKSFWHFYYINKDKKQKCLKQCNLKTASEKKLC